MRIAIVASAATAFSLVGCTAPATFSERVRDCGAKAECVDSIVLSDTAKNALIGGIIGAAIGGGVGLATRNPHIIRTVAVGALTGTLAGGGATYYLEHQNADALADIEARNRYMEQRLELFEKANEQIRMDVYSTKDDISALRDSARRSQKLAVGAKISVQAYRDQLIAFEEAVRARDRTPSQAIQEQIKIYLGKTERFQIEGQRSETTSIETLKRLREMGLYDVEGQDG